MPFNKSEYIWFDGEFVPWDQAKVHVLSHALHYGSSVFEGIRCYETASGPAVFCLEQHVKRMVRSCKIYRMEIPYPAERLSHFLIPGESAPHVDVPLTQGQEIGEIDDIVGHLPADIPIESRMESLRRNRTLPASKEFPPFRTIPPPDRSRGDHRTEADPRRSDQPSLASEKDRGLPEHDPAGDIPQE